MVSMKNRTSYIMTASVDSIAIPALMQLIYSINFSKPVKNNLGAFVWPGKEA
jgi:hypothetical protein